LLVSVYTKHHRSHRRYLGPPRGGFQEGRWADMKYRVLVRRYETVIRDVEIEVETNGMRKAETAALNTARVLAEDRWGPPSAGHDVKYEAVRTETGGRA
jgi:hypothetical protein